MSYGSRAKSLKKLFSLSLLIAHATSLTLAEPTPNETAVSHFQSGLAYERLGRLEQAYTDLQLACALSPENGPMALALGIIALRLGRDDVAQRSLEKSLTLDANSIASYYELAMLYEKQQIRERALDSWNRFVELSKDEVLKLEAKKHIAYLESLGAS